MGSQSPLTLPIIDLSELKIGSSKWDSVKAEVQNALEEYGCFEAMFSKISSDVRKAMFGALEELFNLPLEIKLKNSTKNPFHGYIKSSMLPLYESTGISDPLVSEKIKAFTNLFWPQGNPNFSEIIQSFSEQLSELDELVRRIILESLGLKNYFDEHMDSTNYRLRVMKYKGPEKIESELGLKSHTDKNILTILCQNQVDGLELQTKDGEWIELTPSPDSFIIMVGDSLHAWSNGRLHNPYHRVMMRGNEARYSAGLFSIPKEGYIIKVPEEIIDEQHPLLYNPYDHFKYVDFYYTEAGQKAQSALKAFCGV